MRLRPRAAAIAPPARSPSKPARPKRTAMTGAKRRPLWFHPGGRTRAQEIVVPQGMMGSADSSRTHHALGLHLGAQPVDRGLRPALAVRDIERRQRHLDHA